MTGLHDQDQCRFLIYGESAQVEQHLGAADLSGLLEHDLLDGDSVPDLVIANGGSDDVSVLLDLCDPAVGPEIDIRPGSDSNPTTRPVEATSP